MTEYEKTTELQSLIASTNRGVHCTFQNLSATDIRRVLYGIRCRATGLVLDAGDGDCFLIQRSGLSNFLTYDMVRQLEVRSDCVIIALGVRPFCNIKLALKKIKEALSDRAYRKFTCPNNNNYFRAKQKITKRGVRPSFFVSFTLAQN